jgi:hypothetical protein
MPVSLVLLTVTWAISTSLDATVTDVVAGEVVEMVAVLVPVGKTARTDAANVYPLSP